MPITLKYAPIWEKLKKSSPVSIAAPIESHRRIIKAVIKEKWKDAGYKLLLAEKALEATLEVRKDSSNPKVIHFSLVTRTKLAYIGLDNLV